MLVPIHVVPSSQSQLPFLPSKTNLIHTIPYYQPSIMFLPHGSHSPTLLLYSPLDLFLFPLSKIIYTFFYIYHRIHVETLFSLVLFSLFCWPKCRRRARPPQALCLLAVKDHPVLLSTSMLKKVRFLAQCLLLDFTQVYSNGTKAVVRKGYCW